MRIDFNILVNEMTLENLDTGHPIRFEMRKTQAGFSIGMRNLTTQAGTVLWDEDGIDAINVHWNRMKTTFEHDPTWGPVQD